MNQDKLKQEIREEFHKKCALLEGKEGFISFKRPYSLREERIEEWLDQIIDRVREEERERILAQARTVANVSDTANTFQAVSVTAMLPELASEPSKDKE